MLKDHLREFLRPNDQARQPPSLGYATRASMPTSTLKVDAALFLYHLLGYSPNSTVIEQELCTELRLISRSSNAIVDELTALQEEWPDEADWAYRLSVCLPPLNDGDISVMPSLTKLAENYFNHLGLALWDLPGKQSPGTSIHPTPNRGLIETVTFLLRDAKQGRKSSLKGLVQIRDVPSCLVTKQIFREKPRPILRIDGQVGVRSEIAYIIPFALQSKTQAHVAIETFTGATITAKEVADLITAPENAFLLQHDTHQEYDKDFAWGIEAVCESDGTIHYYTRAVRPDQLSGMTKAGMEKEVAFGTRSINWADGNAQPLVSNPNPRFCNLMLAIMRVLHASGAAEVLDQLRETDEESREDGSNMGSSSNVDDLFMSKLTLLAMSRPVMVN